VIVIKQVFQSSADVRLLKHRKGQAALEFLTTYGWVLLVVVVTVGVLFYFDVLNPNKYFAAECEFGTNIICEAWVLEKNNNEVNIRLKLRNNLEKSIEPTSWSVKTKDLTQLTCNSATMTCERCSGTITIGNDCSQWNNDKTNCELHNATEAGGCNWDSLTSTCKNTPSCNQLSASYCTDFNGCGNQWTADPTGNFGPNDFKWYSGSSCDLQGVCTKTVVQGSKETLNIDFSFKRKGGLTPHTVKGRVFADVQ